MSNVLTPWTEINLCYCGATCEQFEEEYPQRCAGKVLYDEVKVNENGEQWWRWQHYCENHAKEY